jgi:hypothetical protein
LIACIDGLKEGKPYRFRVFAENEIGEGPANELPEPVVPTSHAGPSAAPEGPLRVIRVTRDMLAVHWRPPRDNGGAMLERYVVEKRNAERSAWTRAGTCGADVTTYCVTDLQENEMYYIRVFAENAYGVSEPLETDRPIVPKRLYESAREAEVEAWIRDAGTETRRVHERTHISVSSRSYTAYADEPLAHTSDRLDTRWLNLAARF